MKFAEVIESKPFGLTVGGDAFTVPAKSAPGHVNGTCLVWRASAGRLHA
jgi:hypothetical protein